MKIPTRQIVLFIICIVIWIIIYLLNNSIFGEEISWEDSINSDFYSFSEVGLYDGDRVKINVIAYDIIDVRIYFVPKDVYTLYKNSTQLGEDVAQYKHISIYSSSREMTFSIPYDNEEWGFFLVNYGDIEKTCKFQYRSPSIHFFESDLFINSVTFLLIMILGLICSSILFPVHIVVVPVMFTTALTFGAIYYLRSTSSLSDFMAIWGIFFGIFTILYIQLRVEMEKTEL